MTLNELADECHATALGKGFWDHKIVFADPHEMKTHWNPSILPEKLALIHSEVSEALEALRDDDKETFQEELADVIIRVLDLAGYLGIDIDAQVEAKMEKNRGRPHLHGREW